MTVGRCYVVRIHGRPPAVARIESIDGETVTVRLRQGYTWSPKPREVERAHVVREATPREVAVAMPIHPLEGEAA